MDKRKPGRKKNYSTSYTTEDLKNAYEAITDGRLSVRRASATYNIPRSTLHDKLKAGRVEKKSRTILTKDEEKKVNDWVVISSARGCGKTKEEVAVAIQRILQASGRQTLFTDNKPGMSWFRGFLQRHPNLRLKKTMVLGEQRAKVTEEKIRALFHEVEATLAKDGIDMKSIDPRCIFNCDETCFPFHISGSVVLTDVSNKHPYDIGSDSKHQITVLACASAAGHVLSPTIIYPGVRWTWKPWDDFPDCHCTLTPNGWVNSEVFLSWLDNTFIPAIKDLPRPVVLFADGHQSHVSLEVHERCNEHGIVYYVLPAHASHIVQPLDLIFYGSLKDEWRKAVRDFKAISRVSAITKSTFARVFRDAWQTAYSASKLSKAFEMAGLCPWDPDRPDYSKCSASLVYGKVRPSSASQADTHPQTTSLSSPTTHDLALSSATAGPSSSLQDISIISETDQQAATAPSTSTQSAFQPVTTTHLPQPSLPIRPVISATEENLLDQPGPSHRPPEGPEYSADEDFYESAALPPIVTTESAVLKPLHIEIPEETSMDTETVASSVSLQTNETMTTITTITPSIEGGGLTKPDLSSPLNIYQEPAHGIAPQRPTHDVAFAIDQLVDFVISCGWSLSDMHAIRRRQWMNVRPKEEEERYKLYLKLYNRIVPPPTFDTLPVPGNWTEKMTKQTRVQAPEYVSGKSFREYHERKAQEEEHKKQKVEEKKKERERKKAEKEEEKEKRKRDQKETGKKR